MERTKRKKAHREYEREARTPAKKKRAPSQSLPRPGKPDRAHERARAAAFSAGAPAVSGEPAGERKIDELLSAKSGAAAKRAKSFIPFDVPFFILVIVLLCVGLIMMYSASYAWSINDYGNPYRFISTQIRAALLGLAAMLFMTFFDYNRLRKWTVPFYGLVLVLLAMVFVMGRTSGGAQRWLEIAGQGFQPSELAKLAAIWMLSFIFAASKPRRGKIAYGILPLGLVLITILPFLIFQKHLSAITLITLTSVIMAFLAGANPVFLGGLCASGAAALYLIVTKVSSFTYVLSRFVVWKDPFSDPRGLGYQTIQSLYAIASGGLFGLGLGQSRQKQLYLPAAHNDYVFSIVCEELGLVGAAVIVLLFAALILRGYWIAMHANDRFGSFMAAGITTIFALQTFMNIAVVTNAMPVTGVSLPFFSYGGTSLMLLLFQMGIVLSVSKQMRTGGE